MPTIDLSGNTLKVDSITNSAVDALEPLGGTLTGSTDGDLADVTDLSTGDSYSDAAVNAKIAEINLQLKELQTAYNALLAAIQG